MQYIPVYRLIVEFFRYRARDNKARDAGFAMDRKTLLEENAEYAGTDGVSLVGRANRFQAAFRDKLTGRIELARFRNGAVAPVHVVCGLPEAWAVEHDDSGCIICVKSSIVAGFVRDAAFFTRAEAAASREIDSEAET